MTRQEQAKSSNVYIQELTQKFKVAVKTISAILTVNTANGNDIEEK